MQKSGKSQSELSEFCQCLKNNLPENITGKKVESIRESLSVTSARKLKRDENYDVNDKRDKRAAYDEKEKQEIAQYTYAHGTATAF